MAGVYFTFENFIALLELNIGMSTRLDENRAESFTVLYCDFTSQEQDIIRMSLEQTLRNSDAVLSHHGHYFFVLPYTDKYGATNVKNMFEEFFDGFIPAVEVSYPADGETPLELIEELQFQARQRLDTDLLFLDPGKLSGTQQ